MVDIAGEITPAPNYLGLTNLQRFTYSVPKFLIWIFSSYIVLLAFQDFQLGGDSWKQGDWLINSVDTTIRRGMMGSLILRVSETFSLNPVLVVVVVQVSLVIATVGLITLSVQRLQPQATIWLLILSPGFFVSFWSLDDQGGLRKELITFLAFAILLFATSRPTPNRILAYVSALVYGLAVISHEGNLFFAPFFAFCYYLLLSKTAITKPDFIGLLAIVACACLTTLIIAFSFDTVVDYMRVCQPVLDAGAGADMCEGAIKALEIPLKEYMTATFWMFFSPKVLSFTLLYVLSSVLVLITGTHLVGGGRLFIRAYIGSAFLFLPLYVVAVDWGRWVSFHTSAVIFTLLIALSLGFPKTASTEEMPLRSFQLVLVCSLVWGFSHFLDVLWGGMAWKTLQGLMQIGG